MCRINPMNAEIIIVVLASTLAGLGIAGWAYFAGRRSGEALGWTEHYFDRARADRARRDSRGRFKKRNPPAP